MRLWLSIDSHRYLTPTPHLFRPHHRISPHPHLLAIFLVHRPALFSASCRDSRRRNAQLSGNTTLKPPLVYRSYDTLCAAPGTNTYIHIAPSLRTLVFLGCRTSASRLSPHQPASLHLCWAAKRVIDAACSITQPHLFFCSAHIHQPSIRLHCCTSLCTSAPETTAFQLWPSVSRLDTRFTCARATYVLHVSSLDTTLYISTSHSRRSFKTCLLCRPSAIHPLSRSSLLLSPPPQ